MDGHLEPGDGINVIVGDNAAGKTSLLEAIHVLGRARSFRVPRLGPVIRRGESLLRVTGIVDAAGTARHRVGVERRSDTIRVRLDGRDVRSLSELARFLPLQVINSESQRLLQDGPKVRRGFLNWSVFHVEHGYHETWRRYDRALRQRNAALRAGHWRQAVAWEAELVESGLGVDAARSRLVTGMHNVLQSLLADWLPGIEVHLSYRRGWSRESGLAEALAQMRERDLELGYTLAGPHRADLAIRANGVEAQHWLSRGQQKGLVIAILLAQVRQVAAVSTRQPILLIDDLAAELDMARREAVMQEVVSSGAQVFVTAIDAATVPVTGSQARWYHVEHGRVRE